MSPDRKIRWLAQVSLFLPSLTLAACNALSLDSAPPPTVIPLVPTPEASLPEDPFMGVEIKTRKDGTLFAQTDNDNADTGSFVNAWASYLGVNPNMDTRTQVAAEIFVRYPHLFIPNPNGNPKVDYRLPIVAIDLDPGLSAVLTDPTNQNP